MCCLACPNLERQQRGDLFYKGDPIISIWRKLMSRSWPWSDLPVTLSLEQIPRALRRTSYTNVFKLHMVYSCRRKNDGHKYPPYSYNTLCLFYIWDLVLCTCNPRLMLTFHTAWTCVNIAWTLRTWQCFLRSSTHALYVILLWPWFPWWHVLGCLSDSFTLLNYHVKKVTCVKFW